MIDQQPGEAFVEDETGRLDHEEFDLHPTILALPMAAKAPAAVEDEADTHCDQEGDDDGGHRGHHIDGEKGIDHGIDGREREAHDREPDQLAEGFLTDV